MKHSIVLGVLGLAAALPTWAADAVDAGTACERAARETLRTSRGAAAEAQFSGAPTAAPGLSDGDDVTLRGSGRYKAGGSTKPFTYSCNVNRKSGSVSGVVLRDTGDNAAATAAVRSVEPDLAQVSPEACESATAAALKRRWPNVSRIAFNAGSLQLQQDSSGQASLRGQGTAQPSVREPDTHFSYQCAIDARTGRVLSTRLGD